MFSSRINLQKLKVVLLASSTRTILYQEQQPLIYYSRYTQKCNYVDVTMKWKKDSFYDSIEIVDSSLELKPLLALKNCIANDPRGCIPISDISKSGYELDVPIKVAKFLRRYPSVFEEFVGPQYNLPWFRLTPEAIVLDREERAVYEDSRCDLVMRLKRLILMTKEKKLPFKTIKGVQWYLGLPDDFLKNPEQNLDSSFKVVEMGDDLQGLSVDTDERMLSLLQKNAVKKGLVVQGETSVPLAFPLYPSKGLRLKRKISHWLEEFQKLPYVSPYENSSDLNPNTDISEKRVIGVLHELLGLFVDHSAQRRKLICLRTHLGLPQKFHRAFQRHPDIFYLSLRNKTCTVILKEAYNDCSAMETHPLLKVREKYVRLMKKSWGILKARRQKGRSGELNNVSLDMEFGSDTEVTGERSEGEEDLLQEEAHFKEAHSDQIVA